MKARSHLSKGASKGAPWGTARAPLVKWALVITEVSFSDKHASLSANGVNYSKERFERWSSGLKLRRNFHA